MALRRSRPLRHHPPMRLRAVAENPLEWLLDRLGLLPRPLADTMVAMALARTIMAATSVGIFEALDAGPLTAEEAADRCGTDARATAKLLFALAGARYVRERDGRYELSRMARRWMLRGAPLSLHDATLHRYLDMKLMGHAEEYLRTGSPLDYHDTLTPGEWEIYERGQRAHALWPAPEVVRRTPVPAGARTLLDVGGGHGAYAAALCRRHPGLRATVLDLPEAVARSRSFAEREALGDRLTWRAGDALTEDLGVEQWDVVFLANIVHHFEDAENRGLMRRIARALRPGGTCVVLDIVRSRTARQAGQVGALTDFFFAMTSASGTWSPEEIAAWQREAGLEAMRPRRLRMAPGYVLQPARRKA